MRQSSHRGGFTMVEMLVVAPVVLLTITAFIGAIIYISGHAIAARGESQSRLEIQRAANIIDQDVRNSSAFLATNNVALQSPQGRNDSGTNWTNSYSVLILNMIATSGGATTTANRTPVWLKDSPNACTSDRRVNNETLKYNIIYYTKEGSLYRRVIMPSNWQTAGCTTPDQRSTCSTTTASQCVALDSLILSNVVFGVNYYNSPASLSSGANDSANFGGTQAIREAALGNSKTVSIYMQSSRYASGNSIYTDHTTTSTRAGSQDTSATPVP